MSISLRVAGDAASVLAVAEWLDPGLSTSVESAHDEFNDIAAESCDLWSGESGEGYRLVNYTLYKNSAPIAAFARDVAEVFRAYGNRLARMVEDFEALGADAQEAGLQLYWSSVIKPTTTLSTAPASGADADEIAEWNRYQAQVTLYLEIGTTVGTRWGELEAWIAENMAPLAERVEDFLPLAQTFSAFESLNRMVIEALFPAGRRGYEEHLKSFTASYPQNQAAADLAQRHLRSGNPTVRAAAIKLAPREMRAGLRAINETIEAGTKVVRVLPFIGYAVDVALAAKDLRDGESASSVGVGLAGGMAGGGIAGIIATALIVPPAGAAIAVGAAAAVAGSGATFAYEAWVPLDIRESIDEGLKDGVAMLFTEGSRMSEPTGSWAVGTR